MEENESERGKEEEGDTTVVTRDYVAGKREGVHVSSTLFFIEKQLASFQILKKDIACLCKKKKRILHVGTMKYLVPI